MSARVLTYKLSSQCETDEDSTEQKYEIHLLLQHLRTYSIDKVVCHYKIDDNEWEDLDTYWLDELHDVGSSLYQYDYIDAYISDQTIGFIYSLDGQKTEEWLDMYAEDGTPLVFDEQDLIDKVFELYDEPENKLLGPFTYFAIHELDLKNDIQLVSSKYDTGNCTSEEKAFARKELQYLLKLIANYKDGNGIYVEFSTTKLSGNINYNLLNEEMSIPQILYKIGLLSMATTEVNILDNEGDIVISIKLGDAFRKDILIILYDKDGNWVNKELLYENEGISNEELKTIIEEGKSLSNAN